MKKIVWQLLAITAIAAVFVVMIVYQPFLFSAGIEPDQSDRPQDTTSTSSSQAEEEPQVPPPEPIMVRMVMAGDDLIHDTLYLQAQRRAGGTGYDFAPVYEDLLELTEGSDLVFINQETPIASQYPPSTYPLFNSPPELGEELVRSGFNVINIANNHMLDKGADGLAATMDFWDSQPVSWTGAYRSREDMDKVTVVDANGIKVAFIGVTQYTNGLTLPQDSELCYILSEDYEEIERQIALARTQADVVAVSVHWGVENTHALTDHQRDLAAKMAEWGADIIIGHHSHTIQPVEYIGDTLVIYSLGNLVSAMARPINMIGQVVSLELTKDPTSGEVTIGQVICDPVITHYGFGMSEVKIYRLEQYGSELAAQHGCNAFEYGPFSIDFIKETIKSVIDEQFLSEDVRRILSDQISSSAVSEPAL